MNCQCGFKFAEPGDFRNCNAFITDKGESGVECPKCKKTYICDCNGLQEIVLKHD